MSVVGKKTKTNNNKTRHENQQDNDCSNATGRVGSTNQQGGGGGGAPTPPIRSSLPQEAATLAGCGSEGSQRRDPLTVQRDSR